MQSGRSVTIDGVVWAEIVVERIPEDDPEFFDMTTLRAQVGNRWVSIAAGSPQLLTGPLLDNPPIITFLEGLRAGSPDVLTAVGEACWQCGIAGAEGDPFAAGSESAVPASESDGAAATIVEPQAQGPSESGADAGRPLADLRDGDVVIATYIPQGLTLQRPARNHMDGTMNKEFQFWLESADSMRYISVRLWKDGPGWAQTDDPNHPHVEIAGITWFWNDFEHARMANLDPFSVWVYLDGLDRLEAERFIEGLRVVPIEEFPGSIASDGAEGLSVINSDGSSDTPEIVASDDRFELTAVQVGVQVCTKLDETIVPVTMTFAADCWDPERFAESGIVDFFPLDATDTNHLIIGVIDSPSANAVRITSPDGESVVVPTGPVNESIDGRFFLARLDLDVSNGIRLDRFTIEDASP